MKDCPKLLAEFQSKNKEMMKIWEHVHRLELDVERAFRTQKIIVNETRSTEAGIHSKQGEKKLHKLENELKTAQKLRDRITLEREYLYTETKHAKCFPKD